VRVVGTVDNSLVKLLRRCPPPSDPQVQSRGRVPLGSQAGGARGLHGHLESATTVVPGRSAVERS